MTRNGSRPETTVVPQLRASDGSGDRAGLLARRRRPGQRVETLEVRSAGRTDRNMST